ncbi:hypothetical protein [Sulfuricurvum sp.]|uniref:hypothetical protein n=1 Tax=Sulfuricurvum sp. TaxID=2025608 RepID=UPI00260678E1|nr:hypothetical protein [Sulfuricurvum sp.]MDD2781190.1 hypothetical protein [Sulfuricurvum sp.]
MASVRTITQAFNAIGFKLEIESMRFDIPSGKLIATAVSNKALNPASLGENLKEQGIRIEQAHLDGDKLSLVLDTQNAVWNVLLLGSDEGAELKRVNAPQWFRVEHGQQIRIEPPYTSKWYPDVAVLDVSMQIVSSFRSLEAKEELQFELPSGSYYLKVSNAQGMKVLREGMWIESLSPGR